LIEIAGTELRPPPVAPDPEVVADETLGINIGAKVQQAAILRVAGVPLTVTTEKTKMPKIDKEILEGLSHHQAARDMLTWILTDKTVSTIDGFDLEDVQEHTEPNGTKRRYGWLHPHWTIHKITGRWGSSPNVQNVSKRAGGGVENLRKMYVAPPGLLWVGLDYAQLEARLMAACSQDTFLLDIFKTKQDIHTAFGMLAFPSVFPKLAQVYATHKGQPCGPVQGDPKSKCDMCKQRDKLRDLTKRLEYGGLYGGAPETLWQSVVKDEPDLKLETVRQFLATVNRQCAGLRVWQKNLLDGAIRAGEIRSPILGRREVFPMGRVDPTVVSNYPMQSGGSDLWGLGAVKFADRYDQFAPVEESPRIIHNGHDSVGVLCTEDRGDEVMKAAEECWYYEWAGVEFPIEPAKARCWADT
jgi:hypothetical protein